ncbi:MAG TPA: protein kinase [Vicinamibacterales bacterium]|jgi:tRNA A-37 threonylcarbamoyl transferase component Bud32|nr:protein kinase [Vicinamibacterales bacterium]
MTASSPRVWLAGAAAAFIGYFCLLVYCDIVRPEYPGTRLDWIEGRAIVTALLPESPADRAGVKAGDVIVSIDGHPIGHRMDVEARDENIELGRPRDYAIDRGGARVHVAVTAERAAPGTWHTRDQLVLLSLRAMLLVTLALGVLIAWQRPRDPVALLGALLLAASGVFSVSLPYRIAAVWRGLPIAIGAPLWMPYFASSAIGAIAFVFFAVFPNRPDRLKARWMLSLALIAAALGVYGADTVRTVYAPQDVEPTTVWSARVLLYLNVGYLAAGLVMLIANYRAVADANARRRIRVLVVGAVIGCAAGAPVVIAHWLGGADMTHSLFASWGMTIGAWIFLLFPASFAYVLLRHRLFDLRVMARLGVQYALARRALLSVVPLLLVVLVADLVVHGDHPLRDVLRQRGVVYGLIAAVTLLAFLRRRAWLDALDRRFFREGYDARRLLQTLIAEMRQAGTFARTAPKAAEQIDAALHPEFVAILTCADAAAPFETVACVPASQPPLSLRSSMTMVQAMRVLKRPMDAACGESVWWQRQLPRDEIDLLRDQRIDLIVPVVHDHGRDILLVLGAKRSEEPYSGEDHELLAAVADSLALAADRPAVATPAASGLVGECPSCGALHDSTTMRCPADGASLTPARTPRVLASRYRLERRIGRGGMGSVYAATDTALDRAVAVKVLREELVGHPDAAGRFRREARLVAGFTHPNVVTVHDVGVTEQHIGFLVMELLSGTSLRAALREHARLPPSRTRAIVRGVAAAVEDAHRRGLVHRDLKPDNIFLVTSGGAIETPKVLDFGIAKSFASDADVDAMHQTRADVRLGTPAYMAPEQMRGDEPQPAWDLWALGVVAFEMLTGDVPFARNPAWVPVGFDTVEVSAAMETAPPRWRTFFRRALAIEPSERPRSARELADEFDWAVDGDEDV